MQSPANSGLFSSSKGDLNGEVSLSVIQQNSLNVQHFPLKIAHVPHFHTCTAYIDGTCLVKSSYQNLCSS